jgi:hypothetical protein
MIAALASLALASAAPRASALEHLANALTTKVTQAGFEGPLGLSISAADPQLTRAAGTVICGRLTKARLSCEIIDAQGDDAITAAKARELSTVVRVSITVDGTTSTVRGDALETWQNVWAGRHPTRGAKAIALAISVDTDAELATLAGVPAPATNLPIDLKLSSLARWGTVPIALAAGDLDGDRRTELVVLLNEEVVVLSPEAKVLARYDLASAPPAAAVPREPFGALAIVQSPPRVIAWSGRRAKAEVLAFAGSVLKPLGSQDTIAIDGLVARLEPGLNRFLPEIAWNGQRGRMAIGFQAASVRAGVALMVWPDGSATVTRQLPPTGRMLDVGCGSALADLDKDGTPELLVSTARTTGDSDELRLLPLAIAEGLTGTSQSVRSTAAGWQTTLKGRVIVMTGADVDGDGAEEFVFGTWLSDGSGELWVARRVTP